MSHLPNACPACSTSLEVTRLSCPGCAMQLEGKFTLPALLKLPREELEFVADFVRCAGSLKDLGKLRKQSYPTVRARLDDVIAHLAADGADAETQRRKVLDALARGELTVKEATKRLKELGP